MRSTCEPPLRGDGNRHAPRCNVADVGLSVAGCLDLGQIVGGGLRLAMEGVGRASAWEGAGHAA